MRFPTRLWRRSRIATEAGEPNFSPPSLLPATATRKWTLLPSTSRRLKDLGLTRQQAGSQNDRPHRQAASCLVAQNRPYFHGETEPCINGRILGLVRIQGTTAHWPINSSGELEMAAGTARHGLLSPNALPAGASSHHHLRARRDWAIRTSRAQNQRLSRRLAARRKYNLYERRMFPLVSHRQSHRQALVTILVPSFGITTSCRTEYLRNQESSSTVASGSHPKSYRGRHQNRAGPLNLLHPEHIHCRWRPMSQAQAAGTPCALSASCVVQSSTRLVVSWACSPWLGSECCRESPISERDGQPGLRLKAVGMIV